MRIKEWRFKGWDKVVVAGVMGCAGASASAQPTFQGLGRVIYSGRLAADVDVVVGTIAGERPVRCFFVEGVPVIEELPLPKGFSRASPRGIAADGGAAVFRDVIPVIRSYRWDIAGGPGGTVSMFEAPEGASAFQVSAMDGAGVCYGHASFEDGGASLFRWTPGGEPEELPRPEGFARVTSATLDGAGGLYGLARREDGGYSLCRVGAEDAEILTPVPSSDLERVMPIGPTIVGSRTEGVTKWVYTWRASEGFEDVMSFTIGEISYVQLGGITPDASAIFGIEVDRYSRLRPVAWERGVGRTTVEAYLVSRGVQLGGWGELYIYQISTDGRRMLAEGRNPKGVREAVIITLPELCAADLNRDGVVNSQDFFAFVALFFSMDPGADFNGDGLVTSQDFFDFLGAFFGGCA